MNLLWKSQTDRPELFLNALGVLTVLGKNKSETARALFHAGVDWEQLSTQQGTPGAVTTPLPPLPAPFQHWNSRNNRLLWQLLAQIKPDVEAVIRQYGPERIGVVIGSSTSGMKEGEEALRHFRQQQRWPSDFHYRQQELGAPALFLADALGLEGPAYVVATACSSSAKIFSTARRLLQSTLCDAVLVGGVDTLCRFTAAGFQAIESLTPAPPCNPFSRNRQGIHIGEGGALFLVSRDPAPIVLLGIGESSDAHHISAPDPAALGASLAVQQALNEANLADNRLCYVNLHGTATRLNDAMESRLVHQLYPDTPCGSTKALTGHTLGAAGAIEAAILWLSLHPKWNPHRVLPPHVWDGEADPALPALPFVQSGESLRDHRSLVMISHSFAFGGSNCALVLGYRP
ncbi:MAG: beta-ketoacyl-ACP synthase [Magnetococcales bacterium]|nr:beta-ketoacyl-ACP synthase [Magnetococcales bacterium]MBF0114069.1 beta-ketoacyl-ACP synthase [Magnetococcales bacterium]